MCEDLIPSYNREMARLCQTLGLQLSRSLEVPVRTSNTIAGANLERTSGHMNEPKSSCLYELQKHPGLKRLIHNSHSVFMS